MNKELDILKYLDKIKTQSPIIHNITNLVVMSSSANILLALGASPIMAHCESEIEEIVSISGGLVLNIGTLDDKWLKVMIKAAKIANQLKIPVILDAVGAGATKFRTKSVHLIMSQCNLAVLRGNASEIFAVSSKNVDTKTKGVDAAIKTNEKVIELAEKMAGSNNCVVAISGVEDIITNGISTSHILNGHSIMTKVTGMGCGLTAFICAFCAVEKKEIYHATIAASALYGICGEVASKYYSNKPGSFFKEFINTINVAETIDLSKLIKLYKTKSIIN